MLSLSLSIQSTKICIFIILYFLNVETHCVCFDFGKFSWSFFPCKWLNTLLLHYLFAGKNKWGKLKNHLLSSLVIDAERNLFFFKFHHTRSRVCPCNTLQSGTVQQPVPSQNKADLNTIQYYAAHSPERKDQIAGAWYSIDTHDNVSLELFVRFGANYVLLLMLSFLLCISTFVTYRTSPVLKVQHFFKCLLSGVKLN